MIKRSILLSTVWLSLAVAHPVMAQDEGIDPKGELMNVLDVAGEAADAVEELRGEGNEDASQTVAEEQENIDAVAEKQTAEQTPIVEKAEDLLDEDSGWEVVWRDYAGKVKPFSEAMLPKMMEIANKRGKEAQPKIQFILGYMYHYGEGVAPDDIQAQKWYNAAAKAGSVKAMAALGELYYNYGDGNLASKWFKKAAEKGNKYAMYKLGEMYEYGYPPIMPDAEKALEFYSNASKGKDRVENAYLKLAQFHHFGYGTPIDVAKALANYSKLLGTDNKTRKQQVEYLMSEVFAYKAETETGQERVKWLEKAAEKNHLRSMVRLGDIHALEGSDVPQDIPEAITWYSKAAELGDVYSMIRLGYIYNTGTLEMDPDYCKAYKYFFKAAEKKNKEAMYNVGNFYHSGYCEEVEVDYDKANEWWTRSQRP